jgi:hypothetical protein
MIKLRYSIQLNLTISSKEASQQFTSNHNGYIGLNSIEDVLHKINHFVVLCAVKEGKYGVVAINNLIEKYAI